jgi:tRNA(fMet)-specific endonuclease VapC
MARTWQERPRGLTPVVIDTDVVSYILKSDTRARRYRAEIDGRPGIISFMTEAELERWALQANWSAARTSSMRAFVKQLAVVPSSEILCRIWARVTVASRLAGRRIETADAWIASTALLHSAPLVTNNPGDYAGVPGLSIISHSAGAI